MLEELLRIQSHDIVLPRRMRMSELNLSALALGA